MSSHPLARHAGLLQALATHKVAELAALPEKTEVILGGIIANVQARNVQKSRSGLTRMAKLTFEDLSGTTPAMLWPEEFAKMADLVKNDQIGWIKGTHRPPPRPGRAGRQPDHPPRARARRADARRHRAAAQGRAPDRTPRTLAPGRPHSSRQPRPLPRDRRPRARAPGRLQGRRIAAHPLRRPADPRAGRGRRPGARTPARATAEQLLGSISRTVLLLRRSLRPPRRLRSLHSALNPISTTWPTSTSTTFSRVSRYCPSITETSVSRSWRRAGASTIGRNRSIFERDRLHLATLECPDQGNSELREQPTPAAVTGYERSVHRIHRPWAVLHEIPLPGKTPIKRNRHRAELPRLLQKVIGSRRRPGTR